MIEDMLIGFAIGVALTTVAVKIAMAIAMHNAMQTIQALEKALETLQDNMVKARVEQHDGMFYVYNTQDNSFIAQGTSLSELKSRIEERMRNANVVVTEGDDSVLKALKATKTDV
jgi:hypothetical protein